ncbi:MAG: HEAT repeat domain-containing protein [Myxococcota bacterium]
MGLFDFIGGKERTFKKHAARAASKKAQAADRWVSLNFLGDNASAEAVAALLQRFTFRIDPSITDQSEKDLALKGIIGAGSVAVEPVREFLQTSASIAWPIKMLQSLVSGDEVVGALLELLEGMETDYERDPQKKIDLIMQLEDHQDARIRPAVERFLEDANENVRFHATGAILNQEDASESQGKLLDALVVEEGVRVRVQILDGFIANEWELGGRVAEVQPKLPSGYILDGQSVRKKK